MLVLDVDGVLTDCRLWMDSNGEWKRIYSVRDGIGIKLLIDAGYKVGIITGATATDVRERAKMLGIHYFYEGALNKEPAFQDLLLKSGIQAQEIAYMGDDVYDIPLIQKVGWGLTVSEAVDEVIKVAKYITQRPAGNGAVREVCDLIVKYGAYSQRNNK